MANHTIHVGTAAVNLSPDLFHEYALQYVDCERCFQTDARYSPVPYFLLCRSIEIELKARHLESKSTREVKNRHVSLGASKPATHGRFKTSRGVNVQ